MIYFNKLHFMDQILKKSFQYIKDQEFKREKFQKLKKKFIQ